MTKLGALFWWVAGVACFFAAGGGFGLLLLAVFLVIGLLWLAYA